MLDWQYEVEKKKTTDGCFRLYIDLRTHKTLTHNSLYVPHNWGKSLSHKKCNTFTVRKRLPEGPSQSA